MSGISSVNSASSIALSTTTKAQPKKEDIQVKDNANLGKDNVKTSGVQKSPVWEGVKLETKHGAMTGAAAGAIGVGGFVWGAGKVIQVFNAEKSMFGTFGVKGVLISAGVGLAAGALIGAGTGAAQGAVAGKIVEVSKKDAADKGIDGNLHTKKVTGTIGAVIGGAYGVKTGLELSAHVANPAAKAAITVGVAGISAFSGYKGGEAIATRILNKSN